MSFFTEKTYQKRKKISRKIVIADTSYQFKKKIVVGATFKL